MTNKKHTILIVDDDNGILEVLSSYVTANDDYNVLKASSGNEALEILRNNKKSLGLLGNNIECIILDFQMEPMNGMQFLMHIVKNEPVFKDIPVILETTYEDNKIWMDATHIANVAAYVYKPEINRIPDLVDRICLKGEANIMREECKKEAKEKHNDITEKSVWSAPDQSW